MTDRKLGLTLAAILLCGSLNGINTRASDRPQWGEKHSRNMISSETGLVDDFDLGTGKNIKWTATLGSETWSTPVVAGGKVFIGTNNENPRDPRHEGDRGILLCLDEADGSFQWQLVVPKLGPDPYLDWPRAGIVSPVSIEDGRVYAISNRNEVICLDIDGQSDGNDGPYLDEGRHMGLGSDTTYEVTTNDADILWLYDIPNQAGTYPHDGAHSAILIDGDFLYINTSNGVDNTHRVIRKPDGPSLIVLDKNTGRLLARDREGIGPDIFHSTWSSPAMGVVNGRKLVFFAGGNGVMYAFKALDAIPPEGEVATLERVWRFDCDPTAPKDNVHVYLRNRRESPSNVKGMPVFYKDRIYVSVGGDIWWGKNKIWLQCIDAAKEGDTTSTGPIWSNELQQHGCSTPAIYNGMAFVADCSGLAHCIDAETGATYWTHDTQGEIWASPLAADGKIFIGTRQGKFLVFKADREKTVIREIKMDGGIAGTAVAANGVLYVTTMKILYALQEH